MSQVGEVTDETPVDRATVESRIDKHLKTWMAGLAATGDPQGKIDLVGTIVRGYLAADETIYVALEILDDLDFLDDHDDKEVALRILNQLAVYKVVYNNKELGNKAQGRDAAIQPSPARQENVIDANAAPGHQAAPETIKWMSSTAQLPLPAVVNTANAKTTGIPAGACVLGSNEVPSRPPVTSVQTVGNGVIPQELLAALRPPILLNGVGLISQDDELNEEEL